MPFLREKSAIFFRWISDNRRYVVCACLAFVFLFIVTQSAYAMTAAEAAACAANPALCAVRKTAAGAAATNAIGSFVLLLIANILQVIVMVLGQLMLGLVSILVSVAQYNDFVNSKVVENGWTIVRDVTNMFFILVLLLIAFGTMLGIDQYSYKQKNLSSLLIMAVLVNFTRTICGVLIDFGQVVMLTFVYGFKEAAGGNFANGLHLTQLLSPSASALKDTLVAIKSENPLQFSLGIVISSVLAVIALAVSCGILIVLSLSLISRIVMLWLLIVLSPLAFFLRAVPTKAASGYYAEWWKKFTGQVVFGPLMAFVLWLALLVASGNQLDSGFTTSQSAAETFSTGVTQFGDFNQVKSFIVMIVLLAAGYKMSSQMAAESGGFMEKIAKAKKLGSSAVKAAKYVGSPVANAGIFGKDKITGERQSLVSMGRGYQQKLKESAVGKLLWSDKKNIEAREKKRDIINISDPAKRRNAVNNHVAARAKELSEKSTEEINQIKNNPNASQIERRASVEALALNGDDSMKNIGAEGEAALLKLYYGIERTEKRDKDGKVQLDEAGKPTLVYAEKDKDTVKQLKKALAAGGNKDTEYSSAEQAAEAFGAAGQKNQVARVLAKDREYWESDVRSLDPKQFKDYSDQNQQKILKMLAAAGGFDKEIDELNAVAKNPIDRPAAAKARELEEAKADRDANDNMLASAPDSAKLVADTDRVGRLAKTGSLDLDDAQKEAELLEKRYADMGGDGTSQIAQDLAAAKTATTVDEAAQHLAAAAGGLQQAVQRGGLSSKEREGVDKAIDHGKTALGSAENAFGNSFDPMLTADQRFTAARQGAIKAQAAVSSLSSGATKSTLSREANAKLASINNKIKEVKVMKNAGDLNEDMAKKIGALHGEIIELKNMM